MAKTPVSEGSPSPGGIKGKGKGRRGRGGKDKGSAGDAEKANGGGGKGKGKKSGEKNQQQTANLPTLPHWKTIDFSKFDAEVPSDHQMKVNEDGDFKWAEWKLVGSKKLHDGLVSALKNHHLEVYRMLGEAIQKEKKLDSRTYSAVGLPGVYLAMITSKADALLIRLAKTKLNMPRGLPVLFRPEHPTAPVVCYGFFPKFSNDARGATPTSTIMDMSGFVEGGGDVYALKKFSGFLGTVWGWRHTDGEVYMATTAKNSSGVIYSKEAQALIDPYLTRDLVVHMTRHHKMLATENMAIWDQGHGASVHKPSPVVIGVASAHAGAFSQSNNVSSHGVVQHLDIPAFVKFCTKYGLPFDDIVHLRDTKKAAAFVAAVEGNRDMMTDKLYVELTKDLTVIPGTVKHADILGDCLEGLIISCGNKRIKYKFPNYTFRTMALRTILGNVGKSSPWACVAKNFSILMKRWTVTDRGYAHWMAVCEEAWRQLLLIPDAHHLLPRMPDPTGEIPSHTICSAHIAAAEAAVAAVESGKLVTPEVYNLMAATSVDPSTPHWPLVLVMGPIGSGKSTIAQELVDEANASLETAGFTTRYKHLDADDMAPFGTEEVLRLSLERKFVTYAKILACYGSGCIPVVSTGGGVLQRSGNFPQILAWVQEVGGLPSRLIVVADNGTLTGSLKEQEHMEKVRSSLQHRFNDGLPGWNVPRGQRAALVRKVCKISVDNVAYLKGFEEQAPVVIPFQQGADFKPVRLDPNQGLPIDVPAVIPTLKNGVKQERAICEIPGLRDAGDKFKHVTVSFNPKATTKDITIPRIENGVKVPGVFVSFVEVGDDAPQKGETPASKRTPGGPQQPKWKKAAKGKKLMSASCVVLDPKAAADLNLREHAHVTIKASGFAPKDTVTLARSLLLEDGANITINMFVGGPCEMRMERKQDVVVHFWDHLIA